MTCGRCNALLGRRQSASIPLSLVCALLGLVLLGLGLVIPAGSLTLQGGRFAEVDLFQGVELLQRRGTWELGIAVVLTLAVVPALKLISIALISICAMRGHAPRWVKSFFSIMRELGGWAMVDVFLLGAMIALIRLRSWGYVWFGPALLALGGAALCILAIDALVDSRALWRRVGTTPKGGAGDPATDSEAERSARSVPPIGCRHCGLVVHRRAGQRCPRCEQALKQRKPHSLRRTWAFLVAGSAFLLPANMLPVMTLRKMGRGGADTILSGTIELSQHGLWGLALIVFTASIVVPILKLVCLAVILVMTQRRSTASLRARTRAYRAVAIIGRWSMIDIFATMTLVAVGRFGWLGYVLPGAGASAFCAVVFLTMIAAESFDPRLMWDAAGRNAPRPVTLPLRTGMP